MEMEEEEKNAMSNPTLQQPLPPGVESFQVPSASAPIKQASVPLKSLPSGQPLPPGLEDEEYPYSSPFPPPPPPQTAAPPPPPPHGLPPLGPPPPPQNVNFPRHPNPVGYHIPPPHYNPAPPPPPPPPPSSYNMGPPPQAGNFNTSFVSAPPVHYGKPSNPIDEPPPMLRNKRKFQDVDNDMNPENRDQVREPWEKKVPVPMRGRYNPRPNMRGGGGRYRGHHQHRGFMRPRGRNGPPHRTRWCPPGLDEDKSRYDANIRSEWDSHIKEFEEKRTREKQRERERDRDRPSSSRSYGSSKNRSSDKGSDDSP
ncbi:hypothetical protein L9F63_020878 [Diploptera punctata]|uniref:Uncharacterized protein n=1 Tax=Diploptera punctata TaxID=6984 RepID=A0AAD7ZQM6_DIPPU|nr:hypothetical protein L9F63_020878 [Diploptera punctata]